MNSFVRNYMKKKDEEYDIDIHMLLELINVREGRFSVEGFAIAEIHGIVFDICTA